MAVLAQLLLVAALARSQAPDWRWARSAAGTGADHIMASAIDPWGGLYVVGSFESSITVGSTTLNAVGGADAFIARMDGFGTWRWAVGMGSIGVDEARAVVVDAQGMCYVAGNFEQAITLGGLPFAVSGANDLFIAKFDTAGSMVWANTSNGMGYGFAGDLTLDGGGGLWLASACSAQEAFGPDTLSVMGSLVPTVVKMGTDGTWQWTRIVDGPGYGAIHGAVHSPGKGLVAVGEMQGTLYAGNDTLTASGFGSRALLFFLSDSGTVYRSWKAGGTSVSVASDIAIDGNKRLFVVGNASNGSAQIGDTLFAVNDLGDGFVLRLTQNGFSVWGRKSDGAAEESFSSITVHPDGWLVVGGAYRYGQFHAGNKSLPADPTGNALVAGLSLGGNWTLARGALGSGEDWCTSVAAANNGDILASGFFRTEAVLGLDTLVSDGSWDPLVAKLGVLSTALTDATIDRLQPFIQFDEDGCVVSNVPDGPLRYELFDAAGRSLKNGSGWAAAGKFELRADRFSSGWCALRLIWPNSAVTVRMFIP